MFIESSRSAFGASHRIKVPWSSLPLPSSQRDLDRDLGLVITCLYIYLGFTKVKHLEPKARKVEVFSLRKMNDFGRLTFELQIIASKFQKG